MEIKILGTGCAKCKKLLKNAEKAVKDSGVEATIIKVEDVQDIMAYGVMSTPAIVIDEEVKIFGKVASPKEIAKLF